MIKAIIKSFISGPVFIYLLMLCGCSTSMADQIPVKSIISSLDGFESVSLGMSLSDLRSQRKIERDDSFYFTSDKDLYIEMAPRVGIEGVNYYFLKEHLIAASFWFKPEQNYHDQILKTIGNITKELGRPTKIIYRTLDGRKFLVYPNLIWDSPKASVKLQFLSPTMFNLSKEGVKNNDRSIELTIMRDDKITSEMVTWGLESVNVSQEIINDTNDLIDYTQKSIRK